MPLDIPALPATGQTIRIARAAWDVSRDGGLVGLIPIPSQQVPAGSRVLAVAYDTTTPFVDLVSSTFAVYLGSTPVSQALDPVATPAGQDWTSQVLLPILDGSFPLSVVVAGTGYSAGACNIFVFYI